MARSQSYSPIASHGKVPKAITSPGGRKTRMPKIVPCNWPECEAAFSRKADMVRHLRAVHLNIKNFECPYEDCPRVFAQKSSLTSHLNVHTQAKPYACPTCERPFGDQSSCTRHWREQHDGRKFFCAWCTSSNKRRAAFRKHLIEHQVPNVKTMDLDAFLLPKHYTVDDLERLPLFHGADMAGLEMRRKKPVTATSSRHMLLDPALICMDRASSLDSLASTPSLSPAASPAPSSEDDSAGSYAMDPSRFDFGGNALGVHFDAEIQHVYLSPLSNVSSPFGAATEGTDSYASHGYAPMHADQGFYPQGCDTDTQMPNAASFPGYDLYDDHDMTLGMTAVQHQGLHMNYMTPPISHYGRSSHAQASAAWGPLP